MGGREADSDHGVLATEFITANGIGNCAAPPDVPYGAYFIDLVVLLKGRYATYGGAKIKEPAENYTRNICSYELAFIGHE